MRTQTRATTPTIASSSARARRDALLKVRLKTTTKERWVSAADKLDLDQSTLVRIAVQEYLSRHMPDAA